MKRFFLHGIGSSAFLLTLAVAHAQTNLATLAAGPSDGFTAFDAPGAVITYGVAINPAGVIAGNYFDASFVPHGFVRAKDGTLTTFDVPGAVDGTEVGSGNFSPGALNPDGSITGTYFDESFVGHGYLRAPDGTLTTFDVPGSVGGTFGAAITPGGVITGYYYDASSVTHGFVRAPDGTFTTFDAPGAEFGTVPYDINPKGAITGQSFSQDNFAHVFVRAPDGSFTVLDLGTYGQPSAINPHGAITGAYLVANVWHSFLRAPDGSLTTFDVPGAGTGSFQGTFALAINPSGKVTGQYFDAGGVSHGFVRAKDGTITTFDAPDPDATSTFAYAINPSGVITGGFGDATGVTHGFVLE